MAGAEADLGAVPEVSVGDSGEPLVSAVEVVMAVTLEQIDERLARIEGLLLRLAPPTVAAGPSPVATVTPIRRAEIAMLARAAVSQKRGR